MKLKKHTQIRWGSGVNASKHGGQLVSRPKPSTRTPLTKDNLENSINARLKARWG
jgi:hypothetical protein